MWNQVRASSEGHPPRPNQDRPSSAFLEMLGQGRFRGNAQVWRDNVATFVPLLSSDDLGEGLSDMNECVQA